MNKKNIIIAIAITSVFVGVMYNIYSENYNKFESLKCKPTNTRDLIKIIELSNTECGNLEKNIQITFRILSVVPLFMFLGIYALANTLQNIQKPNIEKIKDEKK